MQLAKAMGMRPIVVDTSDVKKEMAMKMSVEAFFDFREGQEHCRGSQEAGGWDWGSWRFCYGTTGHRDAISYIENRVGGRVMCVGTREFLLPFILNMDREYMD